MTHDPDLLPDDPEAKLTALLLGELPALEAEELKRRIAADPQQQALLARLKRTVELVQEASRQAHGADAAPQLSPTRRAQLLATLRQRTAPHGNAKMRWRSWVPLAAAACLIGLLSLIAFGPTFTRARSSSLSTMAALGNSIIDVTTTEETSTAAIPEGKAAPVDRFESEQVTGEYFGTRSEFARQVQDKRMVDSSRSGGALAKGKAAEGRVNVVVETGLGGLVNRPAVQAALPPSATPAASEPEQAERFRSGKSASSFSGPASGAGGGGFAGGAFSADLPAQKPAGGSAEGAPVAAPETQTAVPALMQNGLAAPQRAPESAAYGRLEAVKEIPVLGDEPRLGFLFKEGGQAAARADANGREEVRQSVTKWYDPSSEARGDGRMDLGGRGYAARGSELQPKTSSDESALDRIRDEFLKKAVPQRDLFRRQEVLREKTLALSLEDKVLPESRLKEMESVSPGKDLDSLSAETKPAPRANPNIPLPETSTRANAFSTFSLNVADVSFRVALAALQNSTLPEPQTVRSEEFVNAFDYRDPVPPPGSPVSLKWERAAHPFAHNRDVLRFSVKTAAAGRGAGQRLNLVLLLDHSGSMERPDRVAILEAALAQLGQHLAEQDLVSVIVFARVPQLLVDGWSGAEAGRLVQRVNETTREGGTNLEAAMDLAYATAARHFIAGGNNRIVLMTDGAANLGDVDPDTLTVKVEAQRKRGIALDCYGIGWEGYNDALLERLSRNADGRYAFLNDPVQAGPEFAVRLAGALQVAAGDVKVQVEFNPERTVLFRQVGYATHQLKKEDFRNDQVDAAEIGAAEAGNALYLAEVDPNGRGPIATVHVRYRRPDRAEREELAWVIPYSGPAAPLEGSSASLRLATVAASFAEWLAQNPYASEVTPSGLLAFLNGVPEAFPHDPRPAQLRWMIQQAQSLAVR